MAGEAVIIAGPNGAGKSTFAEEYLAAYPRPFLSADAIAAQLDPAKPERARVQAGRAFFNRLNALIRKRESFVVESTLSGLGMERIIAQLKTTNYVVTIVFIFLESPSLCVTRVRERVRKGGHSVPEEDIVRRFYRSKQNFWNVYRQEADFWSLVYNATTHFQEVAAGEGEHYEVSDEERLKLFLEDLDE